MQKRIWIPILQLMLAVLACALPTGDGSLFKDDFSSESNGWGTGTDPESSAEYGEDKFVMQVFTQDYFMWSFPQAAEYENIHIEVTAENTSGGLNTAFGVVCDYADSDHFNYFAVLSSGEYAIAKTVPGQDDFFLTNDDQLGSSDAIAQGAASYRIGADCSSDGTLTLYVDGTQVDTVTDTTRTKGNIGLFVWTGDDSTAEVHYDDVVVTSLSK